MTALPKKKHTRSRSGKRRGAKRQALPNFTRCPSCNTLKLRHVQCPKCGYYHSSGENKQK